MKLDARVSSSPSPSAATVPSLLTTACNGALLPLLRCLSLWKFGRQYWTDFTVGGNRYRKRLGTTNLQVAKRRERELLEAASRGLLAANEQGPERLSSAIEVYLAAKRMRCAARHGQSSWKRSAS